jgi:opacity protein-like surface antigen
MKKYIVAVILMFFTINAYASEWTGNVNGFIGQKTLEEDDWAPLDKQAEFGVLVDFKQQDWPVSIAIDVLGSVDKVTVVGVDVGGSPVFDADLEAYTFELDIGARKIWEVSGSSIRPYIGGGLALVHGEIHATDVISVVEDDNGTGFWLGGGVYWTLSQHFNLGLDLRYSKADITLFDVDVDAGGTHAGIILGYQW